MESGDKEYGDKSAADAERCANEILASLKSGAQLTPELVRIMLRMAFHEGALFALTEAQRKRK